MEQREKTATPKLCKKCSTSLKSCFEILSYSYQNNFHVNNRQHRLGKMSEQGESCNWHSYKALAGPWSEFQDKLQATQRNSLLKNKIKISVGFPSKLMILICHMILLQHYWTQTPNSLILLQGCFAHRCLFFYYSLQFIDPPEDE